MMHRLGKIWTAGIAYVALAAGAGLSIMYNVLQTTANRGTLLAWHDIVTAVAMPGLVVLMVELYVNRRWTGLPWYYQVMRVVGLGGIGLVAMRASWTHGHAWLLAHGQTPDVAIAWPLAIDALAIMATALLLAGRRGHVATPATVAAEDTLATPDEDMALPRKEPFWPPAPDALDMAIMKADPVTTRPEGELEAWVAGYERAIDEAGRDLANEAERFVSGVQVPVMPGPVAAWTTEGATVPPLPRRDGPLGVPAEAVELLRAWEPAALGSKDVDALLAAYFGRTPRTVRRWRSAVLGSVSAPPSS